MKNILSKLIFATIIVATGVFLNSCQDDDTIDKEGKPRLVLQNNTVTVTEGETAVFNMILDYAVDTKIDLRIDLLDDNNNPMPVGEVLNGNGFDLFELDDIDFPIHPNEASFQVAPCNELSGNMYRSWFGGGEFSFGYLGGSGYYTCYDPFEKNLQLNIKTKGDLIENGSRSVKLRISSTSNLKATIDEIITINIEDSPIEDLTMTFSWDGNYLGTTDVCDINAGLDLDLELYQDGTFVAFSYSDCPESITIPANAPDALYRIDASLWTTNGNMASGNIPAILEFNKNNTFSEQQDLSSLFPINDGGLNDGNNNAITSLFIEKIGATYIIKDSNDDLVVSGKNHSQAISHDEKIRLKSK